MVTTSNAAVRPPDVIQVLQLFMNDSLSRQVYWVAENCCSFLHKEPICLRQA
ncbi:hypothetical protein SAMN05421881_10722 [Nitrosomonas halophila]|uniref:Uncharacterized protein n=1 Tax=Nitrosomonas halophila TaxID=44576 RepID=A0A1H3NDP1_9PROT|nr:hypothetical protein SAMN05421881_10722 [Nitrosomonas halophila]